MRTNKDHYKYYKSDVPEIKNYLNKGIIPLEKRRDRYTSKYNGLVLNRNKLSFDGKEIVYQEDIPSFVRSWYFSTEKGLVNPQTLYVKMRKDNSGFTRNQVINEVNKLNAYQIHKPIKSLSVKKSVLASGPLMQWQIDITSLEPFNGYQYIIVIIDVFSKFIYTRATKTKEAKQVVEFLRDVFRIEKPKVLQSDRGSEFIDSKVKELLIDNNVKQILSKAYTPQTQGLVERTNRTLKGMLYKSMTIEKTKNWVALLPDVTTNYNNTQKQSIGMSPNEVKIESPQTIKMIHKDMKITAKNQQIKNKRTFTPLEKGDIVRIELKRNIPNGTFVKHYTQNWSNELYIVEKVRAATKLSEPLYLVNGEYLGRNKLQKVPMIGRAVAIYWKGENRWFEGRVMEKDGFEYVVHYNDGDIQKHKFNPNKWKFLDK